ncbi:hypothetical protein M409DRAFT_16606 [Zasmidium cellare ATCC 36951]|uniref:Uncharacterized protein n=1 Tax=Zasmidium cellare ATCC 36951 TaxID=1080233 RepID=A0A6A6CZS6_ZASCE|nr:uncharacterized protein M409DRAFT_16606 [Zasmidium cellare ATCC 36951]KAF2172644.1 hypothetical protein M409DRAFT_16606 [Zasmidium cellare ATCC 36951]
MDSSQVSKPRRARNSVKKAQDRDKEVKKAAGRAAFEERQASKQVKTGVARSVAQVGTVVGAGDSREILQAVDWRQHVQNTTLYLTRQGLNFTIELTLGAARVTVIVGRGSARAAWHVLQQVLDGGLSLTGALRDWGLQKLTERREKRKREADVDEAARQYEIDQATRHVPRKRIKLGDGYQPEKSTTSLWEPRILYYPTRSAFTVKGHFYRGGSIIASRVLVAYPQYKLVPGAFDTCYSSLAELGSVTYHEHIAGGFIIGIAPYHMAFQVSKNGMWVVINGIVWDARDIIQPSRASSTCGTFMQPVTSESVLRHSQASHELSRQPLLSVPHQPQHQDAGTVDDMMEGIQFTDMAMDLTLPVSPVRDVASAQPERKSMLLAAARPELPTNVERSISVHVTSKNAPQPPTGQQPEQDNEDTNSNGRRIARPRRTRNVVPAPRQPPTVAQQQAIDEIHHRLSQADRMVQHYDFRNRRNAPLTELKDLEQKLLQRLRTVHGLEWQWIQRRHNGDPEAAFQEVHHPTDEQLAG